MTRYGGRNFTLEAITKYKLLKTVRFFGPPCIF